MEEVRLIEVKENILADNDKVAADLKKRLKKEKTFLLNLMSSPGSGKTTLILKTIKLLGKELRAGVIEADIDSMVDAGLLTAHGIKAVQLRTGGFCHVDATMTTRGLDALENSRDLDIVVLENVGNLVCPAEFDTGAIKNVMMLSVPEGDDKPLKYPLMFAECDVLLVSKTDYLQYADFNRELMRERVLKLNSRIQIFEVSAKTGAGMDAWLQWLKREYEKFIR